MMVQSTSCCADEDGQRLDCKGQTQANIVARASDRFRVGGGARYLSLYRRLVIIPKRNHHSTVGDRAYKDAVVAFLAS